MSSAASRWRSTLIVTDLDGNPVADRPIEVSAARLEWKYEQRRAGARSEADVQECTVELRRTSRSPAPLKHRWAANTGSRRQVTDDWARQQEPVHPLGERRRAPAGAQGRAGDSVTLIPDKESYQPGDVAEILVQAPFSPAEGLLTVSRSGMLYTERFRIEEARVTLQVPIEEATSPT